MIRAGISTLALALSLVTMPAFAKDKPEATRAAALTPAEADAFVARAEKELSDFSVVANQAAWINATYITDDTDAIAARIGAQQTELQVKYALDAAKYAPITGLSPDTARKLALLRNGLTLPAPTRAGAAAQLSTIVTRMSSEYGAGKGTLDGKPINGSDIEAAMGTVRDPAKLQEMWTSWHDNVGAQMRGDYQRSVAIANEGAVTLGYQDVGALWRSGYDMSPAEFAKMTDTLWKQVEPLYQSLH
ncbi:MAG: M2 family metallopeptidase, partial [Sphingomonas sp.]